MRAGAPADRTIPIALGIVAFVIVSAGAFVGGDVVYVLGNMVSRHAFRGAGTKWIRLDLGAVTDLAELAEATPTKVRAGINDLVVVRVGDTVHAMHAVCAHAGGPLDKGTIVDGCLAVPVARESVPAGRRARRARPRAVRPAVVRDPCRRGWRLRGPSVGRLAPAAGSLERGERPDPRLGVVDDRRRVVEADPAAGGGLVGRRSCPMGRGCARR